MPWTPCSVTVDPNGTTASVTIRQSSASGRVATAYPQENGGSELSFPDGISTATKYWLERPGVYHIAIDAGGATATQTVMLERFQHGSVSVDAGEVRGATSLADFDAVPDWDFARQVGTDSTDAFQAAVDATPEFGVLRVPSAPAGFGYAIGNLTIDKVLRIEGASRMGARIAAYPGTTGYLFNISRSGDYQEESHGYGVELARLHMDGNRREEDCGAITVDRVDRLVFDSLQIRHFQREAIRLYKSVRESEFRSVYVRFCGGPDYAALDLSDEHDGDQHNNLTFSGCRVMFSYGPSLKCKPVASSNAVRNVFFQGCTFHGLVAAPPTGTTGFTYDVTGREFESPLLDVRGGRRFFFVGSRLHASGKGQPVVLMADGAAGASTVNDVTITACSIGRAGSSTTVEGTAADDVVAAEGHGFGTGAVIRTSDWGLDADTDYWVIRVDKDSFSLASSITNAFDGTALSLSDGAGTVTPQQVAVSVHNGRLSVDGGTTFDEDTNRAHIVNRTLSTANVRVGEVVPIGTGAIRAGLLPSVVVGASGFLAGGGASTAISTAAAPCVLLDASGTEFGIVTVGEERIPWSEWSSYAVDALFANVQSSSGNVVFRFDRGTLVDGSVYSSFSSSQAVTVAAPSTQYEVEAVELASGLTPPTDGAALLARVYRLGADEDDTLANDVALVGLRFRQEA